MEIINKNCAINAICTFLHSFSKSKHILKREEYELLPLNQSHLAMWNLGFPQHPMLKKADP